MDKKDERVEWSAQTIRIDFMGKGSSGRIVVRDYTVLASNIEEALDATRKEIDQDNPGAKIIRLCELSLLI